MPQQTAFQPVVSFTHIPGHSQHVHDSTKQKDWLRWGTAHRNRSVIVSKEGFCTVDFSGKESQLSSPKRSIIAFLL